MKRLSAALAALALVALPEIAGGATPAHVIPAPQAAAQCAALGTVLDGLAHRYGERVFWWGQAGDGVTMIITERADTRSWTLLAVHDGTACLVGSGGTDRAEGS
ncbi:MAG: hypothetical protein ACREU2_17610 [Steroidobacteraceae bacterium]